MLDKLFVRDVGFGDSTGGVNVVRSFDNFDICVTFVIGLIKNGPIASETATSNGPLDTNTI